MTDISNNINMRSLYLQNVYKMRLVNYLLKNFFTIICRIFRCEQLTIAWFTLPRCTSGYMGLVQFIPVSGTLFNLTSLHDRHASRYGQGMRCYLFEQCRLITECIN